VSFFFFLLPISLGAQGVITTVAGTTWTFRGDGGPATQAPLGELYGVAVDSAGNVFVPDWGNHLVVKVAPTGILTVVAGSGVPGFSGDGGPATLASLARPRGVAVDTGGNLYIADEGNNRVRKMSPGGTITTVAGTGAYDSFGDGGRAVNAAIRTPTGVAVDAAGNLYVADQQDHRIRRISSDGTITTVAGNGTEGYSGDGGLATAASLDHPEGVAVDAAGSLYIADIHNQRIRKIPPGGVITTVAGNGTCGFSGDLGPAVTASLCNPSGVAVSAAGNLYIADSGNSRIRQVSPAGIITTVAGNGTAAFSGDGGLAVNASLWVPRGVAVDAAGNVYVAERLSSRIRKFTPGGTISSIAGNGLFKAPTDGVPATTSFLSAPRVLVVDAGGNLYIGEWEGYRVRRVSAGGTITTIAGGRHGFSGDGGPAVNASMTYPGGLAVDVAGNLYLGDADNHRIRKISANGIISTVAGGAGGGFCGDGGAATAACLYTPWGVAVDTAGNLYIADLNNKRIRRVSPAGIISTVAGNGVAGFSGDGGSATLASLNRPVGVAVDTGGNLYIADHRNNRVRKVSPGGTITTVAGNGVAGFSGDCGPATAASLSDPFVAVDGAGNLLIADGGVNRVRKVGPDGTITTVAGSGQWGYSGDGGPATKASLSYPSGVATDTAGNLYIADYGNHRVRKVSFPAAVVPILPPDSVVNVASYRPATDPNGAIAPGANVAVFGTGLASVTQVALTLPLSSQLLDSCITFTAGNNIFPAPLFFVSAGQINAQVPFELPPGTATVQVRRGDRVSAAQPVKVAAVSPGIFSLNQQGTGPGAILHADSFQVVSDSAPAQPGEFLIIFGSGLGAVQPSVPSGQPAPGGEPLARTVSEPVVNIAGIPASVVYSGLAPGFVGLYQVNVQVPMGAPSGTQPVQIIMSGVPSNTVSVAVSQ